MPVGVEVSEDVDLIAATEVDESGVTSVELQEPFPRPAAAPALVEMAALTPSAPQLRSSQQNVTGTVGETVEMDGAAPEEVANIGYTTPTPKDALVAMLKHPSPAPSQTRSPHCWLLRKRPKR